MFKAYDVRGVYGKDITEDLAYKLGRAFVTFTGAKRVLVGQDARNSSDSLRKELVRGLSDQGTDVTFTGLCTTPMLHILGHEFDGCINVTASHNPKEYNGFKLYGAKGAPINENTGLKQIEKLVRDADFLKSEPGKILTEDIRERYFRYIAEKASHDYSGIKVVLDTSNGTAGIPARKIFDLLGIDCTIINEKPDGNFPAHDPNPLKREAHLQCASEIVRQGAHLGAVFDGDGDRAIFLDEKGDEADLESIKALVAENYLLQEPGAVFVFDFISSRSIKDIIEPQGGKVIYERVGYSFIYHTMLKHSAIYGAEVSAHSFFREIEMGDSAIFAVLKLMQILKGRSLGRLCADYKRYERSGELNYKVKDKDAVLLAIEKQFSDGKISRLDGVSIDYPDVWFNVRPSNTEPLLRLRIEGKSQQAISRIRAKVEMLMS